MVIGATLNNGNSTITQNGVVCSRVPIDLTMLTLDAIGRNGSSAFSVNVTTVVQSGGFVVVVVVYFFLMFSYKKQR